MTSSSRAFSDNVNAFARQLGSEILELRPDRSLPALGRWALANRGDLAIAAVIYVIFHQVCFWMGYYYMNHGLLYPSDVLFGWDTPRVVFDMVQPGHNARSHVHPLFVMFAKPLGRFYHEIVGLSFHRSAVAVAAMVQAGGVALAYGFFRLWRVSRLDAVLFTGLFGFTSICYFSGVVPETNAFVIVALGLNAILIGRTLDRGKRSELAWLLVGFYTYGITISNFMKTGVAHGVSGLRFRPFWPQFARTTAYCTFVVAAGVAATFALGSSFNLLADTWIATADERRGGALDNMPYRVARAFFLYDVVMPVPDTARVTFESGLQDDLVVSENNARYTPLQAGLAAVWFAAFLTNFALAFRRRRTEELRALFIFGFWMLWDCAFFAKYYVPFEGVYHWSSHIIVPLIFSLFPLARWLGEAPPRMRAGVRIAMAAFIVLLAFSNTQMLLKTVELMTEAGN